MIASRCGRRRRGGPEGRTLGCVLRPKGLATGWGALGAPGPTNTRARGTKNEPTSGPAPRFTIDRFHPARVGLGPVGNYYHRATGTRLQGRPNTPEFLASYAEAEKTRAQRDRGTLAGLIREFDAST